jgi:hypothetical protein
MTATTTPQPSDAALQRLSLDRPPVVPAGQALTWMTTAAALAASAVGVLTDAAYQADLATQSMLRGFDLTTLLVVVPALALLQRHAGRLAVLRPGVLAYLLYSYLFAAVTGGIGAAFLLDVAVVCSATIALLHILATFRPTPAEDRGRTWRRISAVVLLLLALSLGGMWLAASIQAAGNGSPPAGSALIETDLAVRLGITLDLWLLVPLYTLAAVLLWRGHRWGVMLGLLASVSGLVHQLSYHAAMVYQVRADVPGAHGFDPVEPAIIACYLLILAPLVWTQPPSPAAIAPGRSR